jgi:hypothetical protein
MASRRRALETGWADGLTRANRAQGGEIRAAYGRWIREDFAKIGALADQVKKYMTAFHQLTENVKALKNSIVSLQAEKELLMRTGGEGTLQVAELKKQLAEYEVAYAKATALVDGLKDEIKEYQGKAERWKPLKLPETVTGVPFSKRTGQAKQLIRAAITAATVPTPNGDIVVARDKFILPIKSIAQGREGDVEWILCKLIDYEKKNAAWVDLLMPDYEGSGFSHIEPPKQGVPDRVRIYAENYDTEIFHALQQFAAYPPEWRGTRFGTLIVVTSVEPVKASDGPGSGVSLMTTGSFMMIGTDIGDVFAPWSMGYNSPVVRVTAVEFRDGSDLTTLEGIMRAGYSSGMVGFIEIADMVRQTEIVGMSERLAAAKKSLISLADGGDGEVGGEIDDDEFKEIVHGEVHQGPYTGQNPMSQVGPNPTWKSSRFSISSRYGYRRKPAPRPTIRVVDVGADYSINSLDLNGAD